MNNPKDTIQEGRAANSVSPDKAKLGSADERREGNSGFPSRNSRKATSHIASHQLPERWFLVDAKDQIVGRLATKVAVLLMGKDNATYGPSVDAKTNVIVINSEAIKLTGNKLEGKQYHTHSGYLGSLKTTTPAKILAGKQPTRVLEKAIHGMLPKNKLRPLMMERLKLYAGGEHPHAGQQPVPVSLSK
jgi:large subunit ribosomal protein L13